MGTKAPVVARLADGYVFFLVVALGLWTVVFRLALVLSLTRNVAIGVFLVGGGAVIVGMARYGALRRGFQEADVPPRVGRGPWPLAALGAIVAVVGAFVWEGTAQWTVFAVGLTLVGAGGLARARTAVAADPEAGAQRSGIADVLLLGAAVAIGLLLTFGVVRPDADDVDFFSRSAYIEADAGEFPTDDVVYRPFQGPATRETSHEPLVGIVAAALPLRAADVTYILYPPFLALAAVGALYLLIREFQPKTAAYGALAAVIYLALDGGVHRTFGNFSFVRIWQGKSVMVLFLVPLAWRLGIMLLDRLHPRALVGWIAALAAMVGMARTGELIAPAIAGAMLVTAVALKRRDAIPAIIAGAVFPAVVLATRVLTSDTISEVAADDSLDVIDRGVSLASWTWVETMSTDWVRLVAALSICAVAVVAGRRTAVAALATGVMLFGALFAFPFSVELADRVLEAGGISWRTLWFLPVPALVGIAAAQAVALMRTSVGRIAVGVVGIAVMAGALLAGAGQPTWAEGNNAEIRWFSWKLPEAGIVPARVLEGLQGEGVVAAPLEVNETLSVSDPDLYPLVARQLYSQDPEFDAVLRYVAFAATTDGLDSAAHGAEFVRAVDKFGITHACIRPALRDNLISEVLHDAGFSRVESDEWCDYWLRTDAAS